MRSAQPDSGRDVSAEVSRVRENVRSAVEKKAAELYRKLEGKDDAISTRGRERIPAILKDFKDGLEDADKRFASGQFLRDDQGNWSADPEDYALEVNRDGEETIEDLTEMSLSEPS